MILYLAAIVLVISIATHDATVNLAGQAFLLLLAGGLWGSLGGMIM